MTKRAVTRTVLLVSVWLTRAWCLQVQFDESHRYIVAHAGTTLFRADRGIAVFVDGLWHSVGGSLTLQNKSLVSGQDDVLGKYTGTQLSWLAGRTPVVTTAKSYSSGLVVAFECRYPAGANGTSLTEQGFGREEVIANFPAFSSVALPDTLSWSGSFVQASKTSSGPTGGPTVFFNSSDESLQTVLVGSAMSHFKSSSAGSGKAYDGSEAWAPGIAGTVQALEPGFAHTTVLALGSASGLTAAVAEWGALMQRVHHTRKLRDITLTNIGYQTDNGAYYVFCRDKNCSQTLIAELASLKQQGVPMGYLSFQGAGASSVQASAGPPAAPWCVNTWGPDLQGHGAYLMPLKQFQQAIDIPLQLYAPYFCPGSEYFSRVNRSSPWSSVASNTSLQGCADYGFQDVLPAQSRAFYDWFFDKGAEVGMASFEPDFMNQNYNCVSEFIRSTTAANQWQQGMAGAALARNMTVQWCYATPTDVMAALDMPAVTNFRVSFDFCYGNSWNIGASSLLVWALGSAPSKDTLWTSDNNRFAVPGCNWSPDHEPPAAELHVVLALMSTGPVGISDGLGMTNASLIKRAISSDGTLLKPSKAITSVDSALASTVKAPDGHVYSTFSQVGEVLMHQFVSFKLNTAFELPASDFYPGLQAASLVHRSFNSAPCLNNTPASSCVGHASASSNPVLVLPRSDHTNVTGGSDFAPAVTSVWPVCSSGWAMLGELSKYVPLSPVRFKEVGCMAGGLTATIVGAVGEVVELTVLQPGGAGGVVRTQSVAIPAERSASVSFE